jgi:hypothetical protein
LDQTNAIASNRSPPFLRWTVGAAKPKKGKTDGTVMTVNIAKLDPTNGGSVCVDLSGDCWRLGALLTRGGLVSGLAACSVPLDPCCCGRVVLRACLTALGLDCLVN